MLHLTYIILFSFKELIKVNGYLLKNFISHIGSNSFRETIENRLDQLKNASEFRNRCHK